MSAFDDYLQLLNNNPKMDATKQWANKLSNNVKTGIEDSLPKGSSPTAMLDYASNINPIASLMGTIRPSKIKEVLASLQEKGFDTSTPWYHGGDSLVKDWNIPSFFAKDRPDAEWFKIEKSDPSGVYPRGVMNKVFLKPNQLDMRNDFNTGNFELAKMAESAGIKNEMANGYEHYFPSIAEHNSNYWGENINDLVYHPKFQKYLAKEGKNGLRNRDALDRGYIDISAITKPEDIYNITTKRPTLQAYIKNKIPTSVLPKIKSSK
jgi:hypothetical protein